MFAIIINGTIYAIGLTPDEAIDELKAIIPGSLPTLHNGLEYSLNPNHRAYLLPCTEGLWRELEASDEPQWDETDEPQWHATKDEDGWPILDLRGGAA